MEALVNRQRMPSFFWVVKVIDLGICEVYLEGDREFISTR
jgi:hypothetical protein